MTAKKKLLVILIPLFIAGIAAAYLFRGNRPPAGAHGARPANPANQKKDVSQNENLPEDLEALRSLPYLQYSTRKANEKLKNVTVYDKSKSYPGFNLYTHHSQIRFVDMTGKVVHTWFMPSRLRAEYALMLPNGDVVAIAHHKKIARLDWKSKIIWDSDMIAHHDVAPMPDGTFLLPVREASRDYNSYKVAFDSFVRLSSSGTLIGEWSTWNHLKILKQFHPPSPLDHPSEPEMSKSWKEKDRFNYYHTNSISLLPETELGKKDRRFRKGNALICLRNPGLLIIQDPKTNEILWSWGPGILDFPHMPSMTPKGTILVFDNGLKRGYTRILEIDPASGKTIWEYTGKPREDFYSSRQGSCQRLPNGNTLICDSEKGRAFELDPSGKLVWEFWHPEIRNGKRSTIYRFLRYYPSAAPDSDPFSYIKIPLPQ